MSDKLQSNVDSSNAFRSTCFHSFCESGVWPEATKKLSEQDLNEVRRWKKPTTFLHKSLNLKLEYEQSEKEILVALDRDFNFLPLDNKLSQEELEKIENILTAGHLDMAWDVPELDLVVVSDIKSSIFAVKDRCESLQLHAYGLAYSLLKKRSKYITGIWDASDGKHYYGNVNETGSFDFESIKERIRTACENSSDKYTRGSHCGSCWKRDSCPAHLVDVGEDNRFASIFNGTGTERDYREALVAVKGLGELANKVTEACKSWAARHGGIRSEDGRKVYKPMLRKGKTSLDQDAIIRALKVESLEDFQKQGDESRVYDWFLVKD